MIERRIYSQELKQEAVRQVMEHGLNCAQAGRKLGVSAKTLANWVRPQRRDNRLKQIVAGVANDDPAARCN
jgi:transposase